MKQFLLFFFQLACICATAQPAFNPGATWFYNYSPDYSQGYIKIERTGEEMNGGHLCDFLEETTYYRTTDSNNTYISNHYWTYQSGDTVYIFCPAFPNGGFNVLYCLAPTDTVMPCTVNAAIWKIDDAGYVNINNQSLRIIHMHLDACDKPTSWIMDKIGCEIFFVPSMNCMNSGTPGYRLRCYSDSTGLYFNSHISPYCDYPVNIEILEDIFINNAQGGIEIASQLIKQGTHVRLYDNCGRLIGSTEGNDNHVANFSEVFLPTGIYLVQVVSENNVKGKKFFVQ